MEQNLFINILKHNFTAVCTCMFISILIQFRNKKHIQISDIQKHTKKSNKQNLVCGFAMRD